MKRGIIMMVAVLASLNIMSGCGRNYDVLDKIDEAVEIGDFQSAKKYVRKLHGGKKEALDKISKAEIVYLVMEKDDFTTALQLVEEDKQYDFYMKTIMTNLDLVCEKHGQEQTLSIIAQIPTPDAKKSSWDKGDTYDKYIHQYNEYLRTFALAQKAAGNNKFAMGLIDLLKPKVNRSILAETGLSSQWDYTEVNKIKKQFAN